MIRVLVMSGAGAWIAALFTLGFWFLADEDTTT